MNSIARTTIFAVLFFAAVGGAVAYEVMSSPYVTQTRIPIEQPVPFSHKHHVAGAGIDCRYCHSTVEKAAFAGMPTTQTCMTCHSVIWNESPMLEKVRESARTGEPIIWTRVHDLPDFVYFDHSIHVAKGVGCESCHGDVSKMPIAWREKTLQMDWCLDCHRNPENFVRPTSDITKVYTSGHPFKEGHELVMKYGVRPSTDCSICHR